jgi:3-deoxy-D-manno-octulosonic-acid transferase
LSHRRVFVAGSTHEGEERAALQALESCRAAGLPVSLVLAPRHLERVAAVSSLIARSGLRVRRRSRCGRAPLADDEVLLLDTLGELASVYAAADVAFVGGTLVDVGGHNLLEPVFSGCPVLFGPHTQNVREAARLLEELGAGVRVANAEALGETLRSWLADAEATRARGDRGRRELAQHRGSAERSVELIERFLAAAPEVAGDTP